VAISSRAKDGDGDGFVTGPSGKDDTPVGSTATLVKPDADVEGELARLQEQAAKPEMTADEAAKFREDAEGLRARVEAIRARTETAIEPVDPNSRTALLTPTRVEKIRGGFRVAFDDPQGGGAAYVFKQEKSQSNAIQRGRALHAEHLDNVYSLRSKELSSGRSLPDRIMPQQEAYLKKSSLADRIEYLLSNLK
jgi:hypothetical protein